MKPSLTVQGLVKAFQSRAVVDNVSLQVVPGEIVGLLGPNGAGKTTVFKLILGLETPDRGSVHLGQCLNDLPLYRRARAGLGYLAQTPSVFRGLSVKDNLLAVLQALRVAGAEQRAEELLSRFSLQTVAAQKAHTLSGGERRRLEFARALCASPSMLLVDEPFAGVDPIQINEIARTIKELAADGIGILMTDHAVREALDICHRIYLIVDGSIAASGTSVEITESDLARRLYFGEKFFDARS